MMQASVTAIVPASLRRPNQVVRALAENYLYEDTAMCRKACAALYGHSSWAALELAIRQGGADVAVADDGAARRQGQVRLLCRELGRTDPNADFVNPDGAVLTSMEPQRRLYERGYAHARYQQLLAQVFVEDVPLTQAPAQKAFRRLLARHAPETVSALPVLLSRWWHQVLPDEPEIGGRLLNFELDVDDRLSLLRFGQFWGEQCWGFDTSIESWVAWGTSFVLAERFADVSVGRLIEQNQWRTSRVSGPVKSEETSKRLVGLHLHTKLAYLRAFPACEAIELVLAHPDVHTNAADRVLTMLATPSRGRSQRFAGMYR